MNKKEVIGLVVAVVVVCLLTSLVKWVRHDFTKEESSVPAVATQPAGMPATTTDYWDYLDEQQSTSTQETEESGNPVEGTAQEETGSGTETTETVTESSAPAEVTAYTLIVS